VGLSTYRVSALLTTEAAITPDAVKYVLETGNSTVTPVVN